MCFPRMHSWWGQTSQKRKGIGKENSLDNNCKCTTSRWSLVAGVPGRLVTVEVTWIHDHHILDDHLSQCSRTTTWEDGLSSENTTTSLQQNLHRNGSETAAWRFWRRVQARISVQPRKCVWTLEDLFPLGLRAAWHSFSWSILFF